MELNQQIINTHRETSTSSFEQHYIRLRSREGRMFTDEELTLLPDVVSTHRYANEWKIRKRSALRLQQYFRQKKGYWKILEAGCGNGWLSHLLATGSQHFITGADINDAELQQAKRVFGNPPNLLFISGSLDHPAVSSEKYEAIFFASSIQYFESLKALIAQSCKLLKPGGELHLLDSPIYHRKDLPAARERTKHYFEASGVPGMSAYYFHHSWDDLVGLPFTVLSKPVNRIRLFNRTQDPFPWIRIQMT